MLMFMHANINVSVFNDIYVILIYDYLDGPSLSTVLDKFGTFSNSVKY